MKEKENFQNRVLFLLNYDLSRSFNQNIQEQSVVGAPNYGTYNSSQPVTKSFEERLKYWESTYIELEIPYPSVVYKDSKSILIPKNNGRYRLTRDQQLLNWFEREGATSTESHFQTGQLNDFVTPDGIWWKLHIQIEENKVRFYGYCKSDTKIFNKDTCYNPKNYVEDKPEKVNYHPILDTIEIITFVAALFSGPVGAIILTTISAAAGLTNAAIYFSEGKNFTGTIYVLFAVVGYAPLVKAGFKVAERYTAKEIGEAVKLFEEGAQLTSKQQQIVKETIEGLVQNGAKLEVLLTKGIAREMLEQTLKKFGPKALVMQAMMFGVGTVVILGVEYTLGEVWMALDAKSEEEIKNNSPSRGLWRLIWGSGSENEELLQEIVVEVQKATEKNAEENPKNFLYKDLFSYEGEENKNYIDSIINKTKKEYGNPNFKRVVPSYQQVLNGEIDKITKKPSVLKIGDTGDAIVEIKDKLTKIGYELDFKSDKSNIYNDNLVYAIFDVQNKNQIDVDNPGEEIDSKTLKVLEKKLKN